MDNPALSTSTSTSTLELYSSIVIVLEYKYQVLAYISGDQPIGFLGLISRAEDKGKGIKPTTGAAD